MKKHIRISLIVMVAMLLASLAHAAPVISIQGPTTLVAGRQAALNVTAFSGNGLTRFEIAYRSSAEPNWTVRDGFSWCKKLVLEGIPVLNTGNLQWYELKVRVMEDVTGRWSHWTTHRIRFVAGSAAGRPTVVLSGPPQVIKGQPYRLTIDARAPTGLKEVRIGPRWGASGAPTVYSARGKRALMVKTFPTDRVRPGRYAFRVYAIDGSNQSGSATKVIYVREAAASFQADITLSGPDVVSRGGYYECTVQVRATNPVKAMRVRNPFNGTRLSYRINNKTQFRYRLRFPVANARPGQYGVSVEVQSEGGNWSPATGRFVTVK